MPSIDKLNKAIANTFATCNTTIAKFEATMVAQTIAFELAVTTQNKESQQQLMIDMHTFQMNVYNMVVACRQHTINCVNNYQATFQQALQVQFDNLELSVELQIHLFTHPQP